jgi:hypothetical protein
MVAATTATRRMSGGIGAAALVAGRSIRVGRYHPVAQGRVCPEYGICQSAGVKTTPATRRPPRSRIADAVEEGDPNPSRCRPEPSMSTGDRNRSACRAVLPGVIRVLVLIGVALLAVSCGQSRSTHPKPLAVIVLQYTPSYPLTPQPAPPPPQTRRLVCIAPLTALCSAAVRVARHGAGDHICEGSLRQPPDMIVYGATYGRPRYADLRGCTTGFPPLMQHAVTRLFAAFVRDHA